MNVYSDKEQVLFKSLGIEHLMKHLRPPALYRIAVEEAFFKNLVGSNIEALRRTANAVLTDGKPHRLTPEFEKLLEF